MKSQLKNIFRKALVIYLLIGVLIQTYPLSNVTNTKSEQEINSNLYDENNPTVSYSDSSRKIGQWDENYGIIYDICVTQRAIKRYAFLAAGLEGLVIVDVTNEKKPQFVSQFFNGATFVSITVEGSLAVVISSYDLMYIFDVSIIQSPILLTKSERLFSDPRQLVLNENLLYVADIYNGLVIVDLTNITEPEIISTTKATEGWGGIYAFEKKGSFIYISGSGFFSIIDVTNKTAPELLTSLTLGDYYCPGIAVNDNLAIVTLYNEGVVFIDITNKTNLIIQRKFWDESYIVFDVFLYKSKAILACNGNNFIVIDVTETDQMRKIFETAMEFDLETGEYTACIVGKYFYMGDAFNGVSIYNLNDLTPQPVGYFCSAGYTYDIHIEGTLAYLANGYRGLTIIDISNPLNPKVKGQLKSDTTYYLSVDVQGEYAYCHNALGDALDIIDVSNPNSPKKLSPDPNTKHRYSYKSELIAEGNYVYELMRDSDWYGDVFSAVRVFDVSNKSNPTTVFCEYYYYEYFHDIAIYANYLLIGTEKGLYIYDKTETSNLTLVKNYHLGDYQAIMGIDIYEELVFMVDYERGVYVIDISDITAIQQVAQDTTIGAKYDHIAPYKIRFSNGFIYLSDDYNGIVVLDATNLNTMRFVGQYYACSYSGYIQDGVFGLATHNIAVNDNLLYYVEGYGGMKIIRFSKTPASHSYQQTIIAQITVVTAQGVITSIGSILLLKRRKRKKKERE